MLPLEYTWMSIIHSCQIVTNRPEAEKRSFRRNKENRENFHIHAIYTKRKKYVVHFVIARQSWQKRANYKSLFRNM